MLAMTSMGTSLSTASRRELALGGAGCTTTEMGLAGEPTPSRPALPPLASRLPKPSLLLPAAEALLPAQPPPP